MRLATLFLFQALVMGACGAGNQSSTDPDGGSTSQQTPDGGVDPTIPMTSSDFTESSASISNPERGYYAGYDLISQSGAASSAMTLVITEVHLDAYKNGPIPDAFLASLRDGFTAVRAMGRKVILRFSYNNGNTGDAPLSVILGHIDQLAPILQENADVIAVMQAGFIGAWGEWHDSTNGNDTASAHAAVLDAILTALPASRQVAVRTPMWKDEYLPGGPVSPSAAYDGSPRARVAHHNDCFLASADDYGTYASPIATWESYIGADTSYVAMGGETCALDAPRSDCSSAIGEMTANHWSYLNSEYNLSVIGAWDSEGCGAEIDQRLGYRFAVDHVSHSETVAPGGVLYLEVDLHNSGFASPFNQRPVDVAITSGSYRQIARVTGLDARRWAPGAQNKLLLRLRIPADAPAGAYAIALRLPDAADSLAADPRYAVQLANDGMWDATTGDNVLSTQLAIDPSAPGPRDSNATTFAELP